MLYTAAFLHNFPIFTVRARSARPCREAASHEGRGGCAGPFVPPRPRLPCVRGPQRSAASGRRSDRSGPAAAGLGGPQRGSGRLGGNLELSAARLTGGLSTPPALRATSPKALRALGEAFVGAYPAAILASPASGRAMRAPTIKAGGWWSCRGRCLHRPAPAAAGLFGESVPRRQACLPLAGNFSPRKSSQNAPGAAATGLPWGCAAYISGSGIA